MPNLIFRTAADTRASTIKLETTYTQNRQFNLRATSSVWSPGNRYGLDARVQFQRWPTSFYGIGNDTEHEQRESYRERVILTTMEMHRLVAPGIYVGLRHEARFSDIDEVEPGRRLERTRGGEGGSLIGFGAQISYDTRSGVLYPTQGVYIRIGTRLFTQVLGSDYTFARHRVEARSYIDLPGHQVLAGQFVGGFASGEPPFQMMSSVGEILRGYGSSRYIDRHLLAARIEYRNTPLVWRLGIVLFVGAAQVADEIDNFALRRFHASAGAGLRFRIIRSENINLRWDLAYGFGTSGSYLDLGEAF